MKLSFQSDDILLENQEHSFQMPDLKNYSVDSVNINQVPQLQGPIENLKIKCHCIGSYFDDQLVPYINTYEQALQELEIMDFNFEIKWKRNQYLEIEEVDELPETLPNLLTRQAMSNFPRVILSSCSNALVIVAVLSEAINCTIIKGDLILLSSLPEEIVLENNVTIQLYETEEEFIDEETETWISLPNISIPNFPAAQFYVKQNQ